MWFEKLFAGVLRVITPLGPRFIQPSLSQRIYLLWIFRNFETLPVQVLTRRQLRLIDALCAERRFVLQPDSNGREWPILGTVERRQPRVSEPAEVDPRMKKSVTFSPRISPALNRPRDRPPHLVEVVNFTVRRKSANHKDMKYHQAPSWVFLRGPWCPSRSMLF